MGEVVIVFGVVVLLLHPWRSITGVREYTGWPS